MSAISAIAHSHGLLVVEDACQAHGGRYRGRRVGSLSDASAFSFYPSKNLGAFGDAGAVVTNDAEIDVRVRNLRNLGSTVKYRHEQQGFNRRLDTIQAAVLRVKLRHLDESNRRRRDIAARYTEDLGDLDMVLPQCADWAESVHHLYVVEVADRDGLASALHMLGVQTGIHYPVPVHLQPAFSSLGYGLGDFPVTERLADRILSLPMHPHLSLDDVDFVGESLRSSLRVLATNR
jgi:dTDP-3-amino-3,4,6-trideoxy-alpha-D-glucose transaminase